MYTWPRGWLHPELPMVLAIAISAVIYFHPIKTWCEVLGYDWRLKLRYAALVLAMIPLWGVIPLVILGVLPRREPTDT